jgi:signal transduction histidine kinase
VSVRSWFNAQPVHRKIALLVLTTTTVAFVVALTGLIVAEVLRIRTAARDDMESLAKVIADNVSAAMLFESHEDAADVLGSITLRPTVRRACLYTLEGVLFEGVERPGSPSCPAGGPPLREDVTQGEMATAVVRRNDVPVGIAYVERDLQVLATQLTTVGFTAGSLLLLASILAFALSQNLQRRISGPIVALARSVRQFGADQRYVPPAVPTPADEVGELVRAFADMVTRVRTATDALHQTNEALRLEIAERQRIEQEHERLLLREQEANRLKDEFLATVSHELRTPLNAIVGWTRVLSRARPDQDTLERALASLQRNAAAQARVIDDLIDISRIVKGKLRVRFEPVDLRAVVEAAVDVIRPVADQKRLRLQVQQPDSPCVVSGDRDRLQQIVWNLLSNAVKFTPTDGAVTVTVSQSDEMCRLTVADTGIGIDASFLPHLFERFRQADASMTREYSGLGIGLAIVHELVELHGGSIAAESDGRARGATFSVTLPRLRTVARAAQVDPGLDEPLPSLAGVRALIVDDNPDALEVLDSALTGAGAEVETAESGEAALEIWRREPLDVLLCDLAMPGMSGYTLLEQIRELDSRRGRVTAAIAVTAQASDEHVARSIQSGFAAHIAKPYDPADVIRGVASALEQV